MSSLTSEDACSKCSGVGGSVSSCDGPSGAGKTATLRMLTALLPPDSGRALVGCAARPKMPFGTLLARRSILAGAVIPASYANFLVASTQASAALIGLLFVSVSIGPGRVFGQKAEAGRQVPALSSFTALANLFFVSFSSLIPNQPIGPAVVILGIVAASQTLSLLLLLPNWRRERVLIRGLTLFVVSGIVYGYEIATGLRLWSTPTDAGALTTLLQVMLGGYAVGLLRAWELLGAPGSSGFISKALGLVRGRIAPPNGGVTDPARLKDPPRDESQR